VKAKILCMFQLLTGLCRLLESCDGLRLMQMKDQDAVETERCGADRLVLSLDSDRCVSFATGSDGS